MQPAERIEFQSAVVRIFGWGTQVLMAAYVIISALVLYSLWTYKETHSIRLRKLEQKLESAEFMWRQEDRLDEQTEMLRELKTLMTQANVED